MQARRLVFTTDWSGPAEDIGKVAEYGYLIWSPIAYRLWESTWLDAYRPFREAHPEVAVLPRLRLDAIGDWGVTEATHPGIYWQHRRWMEKALGSGLAANTTNDHVYDWTRPELPATLGQYLCDVMGPLRDQRLIDGVTLINAPELPEPPRPSLWRRLTGRPRPDYLDLVGIQIVTRLGGAPVALRFQPPRSWCMTHGVAHDEKAWASRMTLEAFTASAVIRGESVLDSGLRDLRTFWPRSQSICAPYASPPMDLGSHTIRYMGGALAIQSNLNGKARLYWPEEMEG